MALQPGHDFKRIGASRGGLEYQDLVAVEVLIRFLRDRDLYEWVQVEAEDSAYQAIDDVVACRKDGQLELTQVKFTVDPLHPNRSLSWKWLTERKPNGTSLLQKWATTALAHCGDGTLARAMLKTDRVPDPEFAKSLNGSRVDYTRLTSAIKETVDDQIGSEEASREFFEVFEFKHSMPVLDDYEESLRSKLEYDTDKNGWAYFRQEVRRWAMRKSAPGPDGKIRYFSLVRVFSPDRPVALRQDFAVPPNYRVPDDAFHHDFVAEAATADGVAVLWGPPGRGKSTYLSHCVSELAERDDVVCIRHHYFLRPDERGDGRFSYFAIERSLIKQLVDTGLTGAPQRDGLEKALASAANEARQSGRRLVVVVDGLDHVGREQRDLTQMRLLFDALLPLPEGVRLLVGTQRVEDRHLPRQLLRTLPKDQWTELPTMSSKAVRKWLESQAAGGRIRVAVSHLKTHEEVIDELGSALHGHSGGLPLHLVYSLEALLKSGEPLSVGAVQQLPACPSGEIEDYYGSLWIGLSAGAKRALHLLAGLKFSPPSHGLGKCLTAGVDWWQVLEEIGHLLDCREASVVPFHGSLFAFLRDRPNHRQAFQSLAPKVLAWLEEESPEYWCRAWLWVMRADLGDPTDLVNGPSRDWAIDWILSGYPVDQLVYILSRAEAAALDVLDLPALIRLRRLKTRALNARKYQSNEWGSFLETALSLSSEQDLHGVLWDSLPELEMEELPAVAGLARGVSADSGKGVIDELNRRHTAAAPANDQGHWDSYADAIVRLVARHPKERADRVIAFAEDSGAEGLIETYTTESLRVGNHHNALAMGLRRRGYGLDRDVLAALCLEGIGPSAKPGLVAADQPACACLAMLKDDRFKGTLAEADVSHLWKTQDFGLPHAVRQAGHDVFFSSLAATLSGSVTGPRAELGEAGSETWLGRAMRALERLAGEIGSGWLTAQQWPTLSDIYRGISLSLPSQASFRERSGIVGVRLALQDIAVDLCLLGTGILGTPRIGGRDVRQANAFPLWSMEAWLETFSDRPVPVHSAEGAEALLELVATDLELAKTWTEMIPAESESGRMLLATLIAPGEFNTAWHAAGTMSDGASIQKTLGRLTGRHGPLPEKGSGTSGSASDESPDMPEVSRFDPGRLSDFVRSARAATSVTRTAAAAPQWLAYWDAQGRHADALADFGAQVRNDGVSLDLVEALDTAFEISRKREGRSRAYDWLVRAFVENKGWNRWWSSEERFRARVRAVAQEYPERWRKFIVETSRTEPLGAYEDNGISVGLYRLVYFLVEVGENQLAKRCAMEMVQVFRHEVSEQPLVDPDWAQ